ncbi:MAG: nucleotide exchange factor GrpE [Anaeroplasmataceae bacterium]|nr:nucleotide exchange factor GrpE [Anaeroplasmataceae bacterium]
MVAEEIKEEVKEEQEVENEKSEQKGENQEEKKSSEEPKQKKEKKLIYKEQIAKLQAELKNQHNEYLKVYAEMENTKRRLKEEAVRDRKYASQNFISELINPIDMLVKIVDCEAPSPEIANYLIGFKMITGQIVDILKNEGLKEIEALGKEFDPTTMQAMSVEENKEVENNMVLKVMQTGYMYKDRILRPAMVIVNKIEENKKEEE